MFILWPGIHGTWANPIAFSCLSDESNLEICTINPDGTGHRNLTNSPNVDEFYPTWSPDRTEIVFMGPGVGAASLYLMNSDGGQGNLTEEEPVGHGHIRLGLLMV